MRIVINDGPVFPIGEFGVRHNPLLQRPGGDPGEGRPGYPGLSVRVMTPALSPRSVKLDLCAHAGGFRKRNGVLTSYGKPQLHSGLKLFQGFLRGFTKKQSNLLSPGQALYIPDPLHCKKW
jgi:hypothetical protein